MTLLAHMAKKRLESSMCPNSLASLNIRTDTTQDQDRNINDEW